MITTYYERYAFHVVVVPYAVHVVCGMLVAGATNPFQKEPSGHQKKMLRCSYYGGSSPMMSLRKHVGDLLNLVVSDIVLMSIQHFD